MSKVRALTFVCFMASVAVLAVARAEASAEFKCTQEACNVGTGGCLEPGCDCTCDGLTPCSPDPWWGWCAILFSAE